VILLKNAHVSYVS